MKKVKIFKIQRSIVTGHECEQMLIYDESRDYYSQHPLTDDIRKLMGKSLKIYVEGVVQKDGMLRIGRKVKERAW